MKIAIVTDDGTTISRHFGRAAKYKILTVEDGKISGSEMRAKPGHDQFKEDNHVRLEESGQRHGYGQAAEHRHNRMAEVIADCQVLLCRGMGRGAYESMKARGICPVVTDIVSIDEAVMAYMEGSIFDQVERLH